MRLSGLPFHTSQIAESDLTGQSISPLFLFGQVVGVVEEQARQWYPVADVRAGKRNL